MKSEINAIKKLTDLKSKVSSHYFIKKNGEIINLVPDLYTSWHAGISSWKNYKFLNSNSIGIEISNPGHEFSYRKFSANQIKSIIKLSKFLIKKYKINSKNILGHSDIAPERKKDPGEKFPWELFSKNKIGIWFDLSHSKLINMRKKSTSNYEKKIFIQNLIKIGYKKNYNMKKNRYIKILSKAFQRRFRQKLIDGLVDQECLIISQNLVKKFN